MASAENELKEILAAVASDAVGEEAAHASVDDLIDYSQGRLAGRRLDDLQDHLAVCGECTGLLRDLDGFANLADEPGSEIPSRRLWRAVDPARAGQPRAIVHRLRPSLPRSAVWRHGAAIAAVLLLVTLAALWRASNHTVARLEERLTELSRAVADSQRPQTSLPEMTLRPAGMTRGSAAPHRLEVPASIDRFAVRLLLAERVRHERYRLTIVDAAQTVLWSQDDLTPSADEIFTVLLSRRALAAGSYRLTLAGQEAGGWRHLESYELEVRYL